MTGTRGDTGSSRCPVCARSDLRDFFAMPPVPVVCNRLWPTSAEALAAPVGVIRLGFCESCAMVYNTAFDPGLIQYSPDYENSLHFSPHFQEYAQGLAARLIETYRVNRKEVTEVGCGKGDFLRLLCELGDNAGVGYDRSYDGADTSNPKFVRDDYSSRYATRRADLVCCRHVLEHVSEPLELLNLLRSSLRSSDSVSYVEVPDMEHTLSGAGVWDVLYEHCAYFSEPSLRTAAAAAGLRVVRLESAYGGQFLGCDSVPGDDSIGGGESRVAGLSALAGSFARRFEEQRQRWEREFARLRTSGARVAIWGAGTKGVTFLNALQPQEVVVCAADINPRKRGGFIPGTGQQVVSPEEMIELGVDTVIIMNHVYEAEIRRMLSDAGAHPAILKV